MRFDVRPPQFWQRNGHAPWLIWALMLALSAVFVAVLEAAYLPAALLLGPMIAAIIMAAQGREVRIPSRTFFFSQGVVGCMIASNIPSSVMGELLKDWPLFLLGVFSAILLAGLLGWLLTRWRVLPGTTAIWGLSPGAATAMTLLAEAYGADMRLVAFMQYLRVVCVAIVASVIARIWASTDSVMPDIIWFPPMDWLSFAQTLAVAGGGAILGRCLKIPAGSLLLPLAIGIVLSQCGLLTIALPMWFLAICYAFVGWSIGLRFTREVLVHAFRALPRVLASIVTLIASCGCFALILIVFAGVDPLTAYLATSPGGADSVAIIAASSNVDMPFVMAMQTVRLVLVLMTSPSLARFIANRVLPRTAGT